DGVERRPPLVDGAPRRGTDRIGEGGLELRAAVHPPGGKREEVEVARRQTVVAERIDQRAVPVVVAARVGQGEDRLRRSGGMRGVRGDGREGEGEEQEDAGETGERSHGAPRADDENGGPARISPPGRWTLPQNCTFRKALIRCWSKLRFSR